MQCNHRATACIVAIAACSALVSPRSEDRTLRAAVTTPQDALTPQQFPCGGRPNPNVKPFAFEARLLADVRGRPTAPSSEFRKYLPAWVAAVEQHEAGIQDDQARTVGSWTPGQLRDAIAGFEAGFGPRDKLERVRLLPRAILLHTDIATLEGPAHADLVWLSPPSSLHFGAAFELIRYLRELEPNDPLIRTWYHVTAAHLTANYELVSQPVLIEKAIGLFPNDADFLLMAGGVHELLASPRVQEGDDTQSIDRCGSADDNLNAAEYFYRRAVKTGDPSAEVLLRLGRVLGLRGRHADALRQLKAVPGGELPEPLRYFGQVFIGQEEEALGQTKAAREAFRNAIAMRPWFQPAYLAISALERKAGNKSAAIEAMQQVLTPSPAERESDAWWEYYLAGDGQRAAQLLDEFRAPFRRQR